MERFLPDERVLVDGRVRNERVSQPDVLAQEWQDCPLFENLNQEVELGKLDGFGIQVNSVNRFVEESAFWAIPETLYWFSRNDNALIKNEPEPQAMSRTVGGSVAECESNRLPIVFLTMKSTMYVGV